MKQIPYQIDSIEAYHDARNRSVEDPERFWAAIADEFIWKKKWDRVLEWNFAEPDVKWFAGGKLNITENCLDRHLQSRGEQAAIIWEPNNPVDPHRILTYNELSHQVNLFAHVLKRHGIKKGDRVCLYMGMVPELVIAMLACARIGAIHSVIFGGFSAKSISERLQDAHAECIITCDGAYRGGKEIPLKDVVDDALLECPFVKKVFVLERTQSPVSMIRDRDYFWHEEIHKIKNENAFFSPEEMDAEDMLFILYTSGSTGKPKGVVHTCGGYMVWANYTFLNVFQYQPGQIHFCTADIGWITGHTYIIYGPLSAGATSVMFEGIPTWPDAGRFWEIVDKYDVNIIYTAPTAIRSLMTFGEAPFANKKLSSLHVLGTVGEPINEEAWNWYHKNAGRGRCAVADTWFQTETGGIMISNLANVTPAIPTYATLPLPGVQLCIVDEHGKEIQGNSVSGNLCIKFPWPGMLRTTYGDHERCRLNYFATYPGLYFTGDGCLRDAKGNYRITGRVDDVLNVSGHRIGTAEVENAINMHTDVVESAVVGFPHDIKGQGIYAYVIYAGEISDPEHVKKDIIQTVTKMIGGLARPDKIQFVSGLPKTRSGKIMRRILRKIAEGEIANIGDTTTLTDPAVVAEIVEGRL